MPIITIRIEDDLRNNASAVLDALGLDMPTAVRMYLKAIVRENGLPIGTKLTAAAAPAPAAEPAVCPACAAEPEPEPEVPAVEEAPAEPEVPAEPEAAEPEPEPAVEPAPELPDPNTRAGRKAIASLFIGEIVSVPAGKLTRWKDMEKKLSDKYGAEVTRPANIRWPATLTMPDGAELEIPYWRIVGDRGSVKGEKMIEMAVQQEKLAAEGHEFVSAGHGIFTGIKVDGYKEKLV